MKIKRSELIQLANRYIGNDSLEAQNQIMLKIATARCARLSYMTFDGDIDYDKDIKLHNQLLENKHFSPFEHCARVMSDEEYYSFIKGKYPTGKDSFGSIFNYEIYANVSEKDEYFDFIGENTKTKISYGWCNNFKGFMPYRYILENNI